MVHVTQPNSATIVEYREVGGTYTGTQSDCIFLAV